MSTHTLAARSDVRLPSVNLLPPEIAEARRLRRVQGGMGVAVLVAVAAVGGLYYQAHRGVTTAQQTLTAAQAQQTHLHAQVASFHEVTAVEAEVTARKQLLAQAMGQEIQWSNYLNDLSLKIPQNVWLTSLTATEGTNGAAPASATGGVSSIGSVSFSGVTFTHNDVATWLESLATEKGYANPYFSSSTEGTTDGKKTVTFSSSVTLTPQALSGRYTTQAGG